MYYLKIPEHELEMANDEMVRNISGADAGFTGPVELKSNVRLVIDSRITNMTNLIVGGNETGYHLKNVNYGRDFNGEVVEDLLLVEEGDVCPNVELP